MSPTTDVMLTMRPATRFLSMAFAASCAQRKTPVRSVAITLSHESFDMRRMRPSSVIPALLTRTSSFPCFSTTALNAAVTDAGSATSRRTASAKPPAAEIACATDEALSSRRAATTTWAPAAASAFAIDSPMPWEAPVTSATLPERENETAMAFLSDQSSIRSAAVAPEAARKASPAIATCTPRRPAEQTRRARPAALSWT